MEKSSRLLCLRGGQVVKEVRWDLQKQLCVKAVSEHFSMRSLLDREVLNGVAIERKDPAAFLKISKLIIVRPRLDKVDLSSKLHHLHYIHDLRITGAGTGTGLSVRLPASKVEFEFELELGTAGLGIWSALPSNTKIPLKYDDVNN